MNTNGTLLRVRDLRTWFHTEDGIVKAVDGVGFRIGKRQTFALVGESGCGKSVTAFSIMRLVPPPGKIQATSVELQGRNLLDLSERQMRDIRGGKIGMIFQEPMSSLNPVYTCGQQIVEAIELHRHLYGAQSHALAVDMLAKVGIPAPDQRFFDYPHQMSGGMRQRVMIAMALSCDPDLLIADEPTTALDVTIQAQILDLLKDLQAQRDLSILLITHDLAVVAESADMVGVMYASRIVELAGVRELFAAPLHPYTQGLFRSIPRLGQQRSRLETIPGNVPNPLHFPTGCKFHPRCPLTRLQAERAPLEETILIQNSEGTSKVLRPCATQDPPLREIEPGHWGACWQAPGFELARRTDPSL